MRGYGETLGACLINGSIGVFVTYSSMPATMLVAVRMVFAALVLGVVVAARRDWRALFADRGTTIRLLVCGVALAANLVSYFIAIRQTGVAVAIFLSYLAPLYVAFIAPHLEGGRTEGAVYAALGVGARRHGADPRARAHRRERQAHAVRPLLRRPSPA